MRAGGIMLLPVISEKYSESPIQTGPSTFVKLFMLNASLGGAPATLVAFALGAANAVNGPAGHWKPPVAAPAAPAAPALAPPADPPPAPAVVGVPPAPAPAPVDPALAPPAPATGGLPAPGTV